LQIEIRQIAFVSFGLICVYLSLKKFSPEKNKLREPHWAA
jgi:hypothetical protein